MKTKEAPPWVTNQAQERENGEWEGRSTSNLEPRSIWLNVP